LPTRKPQQLAAGILAQKALGLKAELIHLGRRARSSKKQEFGFWGGPATAGSPRKKCTFGADGNEYFSAAGSLVADLVC
jgi:hypothetical protein